MKKIRVLQISNDNWQQYYSIPRNVEWKYIEPGNIVSLLPGAELLNSDHLSVEKQKTKKKPIKPYDVVIADIPQQLNYIMLLDKHIDVYRLFYRDTSIIDNPSLKQFLFKKQAIAHNFEDPQHLIDLVGKAFYAGQTGTKLPVSSLVVAQGFEGVSSFEGSNYLKLYGYFGEEYTPVASYRYNIFVGAERPVEIWPEFTLTENVSVRYRVKGYNVNHIEEMYPKEWIYDEAQFHDLWRFDVNETYFLSVIIEAKGHGTLRVGPCHFRDSHLGYGDMLIGGNRVVDSNREELFWYFHPGDLKPPLNVYFSGYRSEEGFEGYWMMNNLGAPFLLIGDPRAEGGAFYLGSQELETKIADVIRMALDKLGFTNKELTLSGLSMGTFGALYYGALLSPRAIVLGKPLASVGTMAEKEATTRPGGFPTSLDLIMRVTGDLTPQTIHQSDYRFWSNFEAADFSNTKFIISYMRHDDYDETAYTDILEALGKKEYKVSAISKGFTGRHNDDSDGIIEWFYTQYKVFLMEHFGRKFES